MHAVNRAWQGTNRNTSRHVCPTPKTCPSLDDPVKKTGLRALQRLLLTDYPGWADTFLLD